MSVLFNPLKIEFSGTENVITDCIEDRIIGFVHKLLGNDNKWHDKFSDYNVSEMYGYQVKDGGICFPDGGHFYVTSADSDFLNTLVVKLFRNQKDLEICGMRVKKFGFADAVELYDKYDIIHVSRLLLKHQNAYKTFKDADFIEILNEQSKKKLLKMGYDEMDIKNFKIIPFHFENAKYHISKRKKFGLPTSEVMLLVKGKANCRRTLYSMGVGSSTGYCFGSVDFFRKKENLNYNF